MVLPGGQDDVRMGARNRRRIIRQVDFWMRTLRPANPDDFSKVSAELVTNAWARGGRQQNSSIYFTSVNVQATQVLQNSVVTLPRV